jgi:hypothetical protein
LEKIETTIKVDKDLLDKANTYKINIEAFMDIGFRRYVDYVVYKNKLTENKDDIDIDSMAKSFGKGELKEIEMHIESEEKKNFDIDPIAPAVSNNDQHTMRSIIDIIQKLCSVSADGLASRSDIINEGEVKGITSSQTESALDKLNLNRQIYEPYPYQYKLSK